MKKNCEKSVTEKDGFEYFRRQLTDDLPYLLSNATSEYKKFVVTNTFNDVKSFAAYQTACRTALAHLQLLIKIATWARNAGDDNIKCNDEKGLDDLIVEARAAICDYKSK